MKYFEITDLTDDENFIVDENGRKYTYQETIDLLNENKKASDELIEKLQPQVEEYQKIKQEAENYSV